jgi:hypothetical protein
MPMENGYRSCKNCVHYRIAIFGPLNHGYCAKEKYKIVYNAELQCFEKVKEENGGNEIIEHMSNDVCRYFRPHIPEHTYKWFVNLFNGSSAESQF